MMWMEEVPQVTSFGTIVMYQLPVLGKAQAGDKPFMTVGDWENANDAMKFLQDSKFDQDNNAMLDLFCWLHWQEDEEEVTDMSLHVD